MSEIGSISPEAISYSSTFSKQPENHSDVPENTEGGVEDSDFITAKDNLSTRLNDHGEYYYFKRELVAALEAATTTAEVDNIAQIFDFISDEKNRPKQYLAEFVVSSLPTTDWAEKLQQGLDTIQELRLDDWPSEQAEDYWYGKPSFYRQTLLDYLADNNREKLTANLEKNKAVADNWITVNPLLDRALRDEIKRDDYALEIDDEESQFLNRVVAAIKESPLSTFIDNKQNEIELQKKRAANKIFSYIEDFALPGFVVNRLKAEIMGDHHAGSEEITAKLQDIYEQFMLQQEIKNTFPNHMWQGVGREINTNFLNQETLTFLQQHQEIIADIDGKLKQGYENVRVFSQELLARLKEPPQLEQYLRDLNSNLARLPDGIWQPVIATVIRGESNSLVDWLTTHEKELTEFNSERLNSRLNYELNNYQGDNYSELIKSILEGENSQLVSYYQDYSKTSLSPEVSGYFLNLPDLIGPTGVNQTAIDNKLAKLTEVREIARCYGLTREQNKIINEALANGQSLADALPHWDALKTINQTVLQLQESGAYAYRLTVFLVETATNGEDVTPYLDYWKNNLETMADRYRHFYADGSGLQFKEITSLGADLPEIEARLTKIADNNENYPTAIAEHLNVPLMENPDKKSNLSDQTRELFIANQEKWQSIKTFMVRINFGNLLPTTVGADLLTHALQDLGTQKDPEAQQKLLDTFFQMVQMISEKLPPKQFVERLFFSKVANEDWPNLEKLDQHLTTLAKYQPQIRTVEQYFNVDNYGKLNTKLTAKVYDHLDDEAMFGKIIEQMSQIADVLLHVHPSLQEKLKVKVIHHLDNETSLPTIIDQMQNFLRKFSNTKNYFDFLPKSLQRQIDEAWDDDAKSDELLKNNNLQEIKSAIEMLLAENINAINHYLEQLVGQLMETDNPREKAREIVAIFNKPGENWQRIFDIFKVIHSGKNKDGETVWEEKIQTAENRGVDLSPQLLAGNTLERYQIISHDLQNLAARAHDQGVLAEASQENWQRVKKERRLQADAGDLLKGGNLNFFSSFLENGFLAPEYLGDASGEDWTPFDVDTSMIMPEDGDTLAQQINVSIADKYAPADGVIFHFDGEQVAADNYEVFNSKLHGKRHYGVRTGLAADSLSAIIARRELMQNQDKLDYTGALLALKNLYVPIVEETNGEVIFDLAKYHANQIDAPTLNNLLVGADTGVGEILEPLRESAYLRDLLAADAGVEQKYTIEQHTLMVAHVNEHQNQTENLLNNNEFNLLLALHDIGKPTAIRLDHDKERQHIYTAALAEKVMGSLENISGDKQKLILAMIDQDYLGELVKSGGNQDLLAKTARQIAGDAARLGLSATDYLQSLKHFYLCDMASYTDLVANQTHNKPAGGLSLDYLIKEEQGTITFVDELQTMFNKLELQLQN